MIFAIVVVIVVVVYLVGWLKYWYGFNKPAVRKHKNNNEKFEQNFLEQNNIIVTKEYYYINLLKGVRVRFIVDQGNKKLAILSTKGIREIINFSDLIGNEIIIDNQVVGGISRAVVGGILAGETGAIVGAMTAKNYIMSYKIEIYKRDLSNPKTEVQLIFEKTSRKNRDYLSAVEFSDNVNATVRAIINTDFS